MLNPAFSVSAPAAVSASFEVFEVSIAQAKGIQKGKSIRLAEVRGEEGFFFTYSHSLHCEW